jgi:serralysin
MWRSGALGFGALLVVIAADGLGLAASAAKPDNGPTAQEQYVLTLVNRARSDPGAEAKRLGIDLNEGLAAGTIKNTPKQPLAFNPRLAEAARRHSQWMIQNSKFAHEGEGGSTPTQRIKAAGYTLKAPYGTGENIGFSGQSDELTSARAAADELYQGLFIDADIPHRGHRVTMLGPDYRETGLGLRSGMFKSDGTNFHSWLFTQDFAYTTDEAFLTGVVFSDSVKADGLYTPGEGRGGVVITATRQGSSAKATTITWDSGGYTLQLAPGVYHITADAGKAGTLEGGSVTVRKQNVEIDFKVPADADEAKHPK